MKTVDGALLDYFRDRGMSEEVVKAAGIARENGAFTYPCFAKDGQLLGVHCKSVDRDPKGKRRQWWTAYAEDLPRKGHGKKSDDPAKIVPFGLETLRGLAPGSTIILTAGEEDALSLRQAGFTAISQPGAGLLEPTYAQELAGFKVVVCYDAGEEREARKDALKLLEAGAKSVRVVSWPPDAPHGTDVNGKLVENPEGFEEWAATMISEAEPVSEGKPVVVERKGKPDRYATQPGPSPTPWPELGERALYGLAGEVVTTILPHTEADSAALLVNLLTAFGSASGRGAYVRVGADRHHLSLFGALVGESSKARKGMSWGHIRQLMHAADAPWEEDRVLSGLSSGEGLIHAVRDPVMGVDKHGSPTILDAGETDKRLLLVEGEFGKTLKVMTREGNILSAVIRSSWDGDRLQTLTKNSPLKATGAHVSIIGHVTKTELMRLLTQTDTENGFANRFLWVLVKRSKSLPFGGDWQTVDAGTLVSALSEALEFAKTPRELRWGGTARDLWASVYSDLSEGRPGLLGAATSRAEAQVLRLACTYAVMDLSSSIEAEHLEAALAVWRYCEASARFIFGNSTGDPIADRIVAALEDEPDGLTRTDLIHLFGRNKSRDRIGQALATLEKLGRVRREKTETGGRPAERWSLK